MAKNSPSTVDEKDKAAAGRQRAAVGGVRELQEPRDVAIAIGCDDGALLELGTFAGAAFNARAVVEAGALAVAGRQEVHAAPDVRAEERHLRLTGECAVGVLLDAARRESRIVRDRHAGLRIEARGPGDLRHVLHAVDEGAVGGVEDVGEAVAAVVQHALLTIDVNQHVAADLIIVPLLVRVYWKYHCRAPVSASSKISDKL